MAVYGFGTDGNATCTGTTTVTGMSRSGSVWTLLRDVDFNNLTVAADATVNTNGFKIRCKTSLVVEGIIRNNGGNGPNGSVNPSVFAGGAAAARQASSLAGMTYKGGGSLGSAANQAADGGGATGWSGGPGTGGIAGNVTPSSDAPDPPGSTTELAPGTVPADYIDALAGSIRATGTVPNLGGGGGSGGIGLGNPPYINGPQAQPGGGGGCGGYVSIAARTISGSGVIQALGGNGGNGQGSTGIYPAAAIATGGGGGSGGIVAVVYETGTLPTVSVLGGNGGTSSGGAPSGSTGESGQSFTYSGIVADDLESEAATPGVTAYSAPIVTTVFGEAPAASFLDGYNEGYEDGELYGFSSHHEENMQPIAPGETDPLKKTITFMVYTDAGLPASGNVGEGAVYSPLLGEIQVNKNLAGYVNAIGTFAHIADGKYRYVFHDDEVSGSTEGYVLFRLKTVGFRTLTVETPLRAAPATAASAATIISTTASIQTTTTELHKIAVGRWKIFNNQLTLYDVDGTTPLKVFDLLDDEENPSQTKIFERLPVP